MFRSQRPPEPQGPLSPAISSDDSLDLEAGPENTHLEPLQDSEDERPGTMSNTESDDEDDSYATRARPDDSQADDERSPMLQRMSDSESATETTRDHGQEEPRRKRTPNRMGEAVVDWLAYYEEQDAINEMTDSPGHARKPSTSESKDGTRGVVEVAWEVSAACLPGAPLLIPHAFYLTGLALGLPMLFCIALASWFSHVILAMEARYVGGNSYPHLAASVFPRRWGGRWFGETLVDVWCIIASVGRAIVVLGLSTQLISECARFYFPDSWAPQSILLIIIVLSIVFLVPSLYAPRRSIIPASKYPAAAVWPTYSIALYLLALLVLGLRIRSIDWNDPDVAPPVRTPGKDHSRRSAEHEIMGLSVWGGISILVFSFSAQQSSFAQQASLRQTASTRPASSGDPTSVKTAKRYGWEAAAFFGMLGTALTCMGWGLVGYLAAPLGGEQANIFSTLPIDDAWFVFARLLTLATLLPTLPITLQPGRAALLRLARVPFAIRENATGKRPLSAAARLKQRKQQLRRDDENAESSSDSTFGANGGYRSPRRTGWARLTSLVWSARLVAVIAWVGVAAAAALLLAGGTLSETGEGIASAAQLLGAIGSTMSGFIVPSIFFLTLFHVRKPRSIFVSDPKSTDTLLLKKERQLQRRLSGRRLWQDIGVGGVLLPFGIVCLIRGCIAIATH